MSEENANNMKFGRKSIIFVSAAFLVGVVVTIMVFISPSFAVNNTEGINQFISDQTEVERIALKLKQRFGNPKSPEYITALESYTQVVVASDKYLQEIKLEVKLRQLIDETIDDYNTSKSGVKEAFESFINDGNEIMGRSASGLELVNESSDFVLNLLGKIIELRDKEREKAVKRLNDTLNHAYMLEYSELTRAKLLEKYRSK